MATKWTIYYDHEMPSGRRSKTTVLLTDGCWTYQNSCNRRERHAEGARPIVFHRPMLFATKGGATNYKKTRLGNRECYRVAKYTGPTDPDARPVREVWQEIESRPSPRVPIG